MYFHNSLPQRLQHRAREVVYQSGALVALAEDPRSVHSTDAQLITLWNSSSRGSEPFSVLDQY